ncbi:hypothetical protein [Streptomyces sp. NPDC050428]|uniref:hypothetical protein n=1 Tax=Streptomyces sp. NPDC050428 TaxID=3155757 RepID=UPI0034153971
MAWLREDGFLPHAGQAAVRFPLVGSVAPDGGATPVAPPATCPALVTYLPDTVAQIVTAQVLALMRPQLWLNLTPMPVEHALVLADRAADAGVSEFVHAPCIRGPEPGTRPRCLVYGYGDTLVTSRPRPVDTLTNKLLQALSLFSQWTGRPLAGDLSTALLSDELTGLADHALRQSPTQLAS